MIILPLRLLFRRPCCARRPPTCVHIARPRSNAGSHFSFVGHKPTGCHFGNSFPLDNRPLPVFSSHLSTLRLFSTVLHLHLLFLMQIRLLSFTNGWDAEHLPVRECRQKRGVTTVVVIFRHVNCRRTEASCLPTHHLFVFVRR